MVDESKEATKSKHHLLGKSNILAWMTRLETLCSLEDIIIRNGQDKLELVATGADAAAKVATRKENNKKLMKYIINNCSDQVMHSINPSEPALDVLAKLNAAYGFGNTDPSVIKQEIRNLKFHPSQDPAIILNEIDLKLAQLESAGGSLTTEQVVSYMVDSLSGDPLRDTFWFQCAGQMRMKKLVNYTVETAGKHICEFWYAYRIVRQNHVANNAGYESRLCDKCKSSGRTRIMKTHNTADCRIGKIYRKQQGQREIANQVDHRESTESESHLNRNKEVKKYFIYHDSGASKTMVNNSMGAEIHSRNIPILTAGKNQETQHGIGTTQISLGNINLEAIVVPTFSKNLLSATQLSLDHGCKQIIEPWTAKLTISKDENVIATGSYDEATKLIKIDPPESANAAKVDDWKTIHRKLGHIGTNLMKKTVSASVGLKLSQNRFEVLQDQDCPDCLEAKPKRANVNLKKQVKRQYELLDVIEIDAQGPFSITAHDGTNMNLKMLDYKSNWLYYKTMKTLDAKSTLDAFITYQKRLERQTGREIKRVRTDGGKEFMKDFLSYIDLSGIVKEKCVGYTHHHPAKAERTNQTILRNARAMLKDSLLPSNFYNEAQRHAAYLFNRMPHGDDTISPYEHIFKRKPDLSKLMPFGSVCYAFVPPEKRHKLEDSGIKCRFLGMGDDFEVEEINGYRLLTPDGSIIYSDSVKFPEELKMERLDESFYSLPENHITNDELWLPFEENSNPSFEDNNTHLENTSDFDESDENDTDEDYDSKASDQSNQANSIDDFEMNQIDKLTDEEVSNLIQNLDKHNWWKPKGVEYALNAVSSGTPITYKQAMSGPDKEQWREAFKTEIENIKRNKTYKLRKTKEGERAIGCKWVLKIKMNPDGTIDKYKARLVAKGYAQKKGKDYNETFAPVAKFKSIRIILALAGTKNWKVFHDDATSAFLNGNLKETVLMDQPEGFIEINESYKWELLKTLYGLKQAPREWNIVLHEFMVDLGFIQCKSDPCLYIKINGKEKTIVGIYVDDILSTGNSLSAIQDFRSKLKAKFKCSEGGLLKGCLGIEVKQENNRIILSQEQYLLQKLEKYERWLCPNVKRNTPLDVNFQKLLVEAESSTEVEPDFPYREIVGSLMYASTATRPDLSTALGVVSRFNSSPKKIHCDMVRQILYYIRKYPSLNLNYNFSDSTEIIGYVDASWANNEDYTSVSGFCFLLGSCLISWSSKKQPVVALSSTESEYVSATSGVQEALWIKSLMNELGFYQECVKLYEDNEACINLSKNPQEYKRTRHIQVKYHFIRSHVKSGNIKLEFCGTLDQLSDFLTKGVNGHKLQSTLRKLNVLPDAKHGGELEYVSAASSFG